MPETATWVFEGNGTAKVAAAQKLRSVLVKDRLKLLSNLGIEKTLAHVNPIELNGFALTMDQPENEYTGLRRPIVVPVKKFAIGAVNMLNRWMRDLGGVV
ncbi:MAG: hypothetical protein A4E30_00104 [Methanomassiliicoccales archaeon PtaB.Bin215]|nr:MAG: hypothetical protein A4E30_00104 [Methanomassiliicoccales archaeon PtaB.Bin215]